MNENNNDILKQNNNILPIPPLEEAVPQEHEEKSSEDKQENAEYAFRWEYSEQVREESEKKKKKKKATKKGALTYAIIMVTAFLIAFSILAASLSLDNIAEKTDNSDRELSVVEIVEKGIDSSVLIFSAKNENVGSSGSGFVVNDYGYVVTNYHVVEDAIQIVVANEANEQYSAELMGYDKDVDLALLYVEQLGAPAAMLADSDKAKMGETVVAIGCPTGSGSSLSVSNGIISGFNRQVSNSTVGMIQTNAPLNPGNSGGPLFDSHGNVVGIVTSKLSYNTDSDGEKIPLDGIAYAIPINAVKSLLDGWMADDLGKPKMGIGAVPVEAGNSYYYDGNEGYIYGYENILGVEYKVKASGEKQELTEEELSDPNTEIIHAEVTGIYVVSVTKGLGAYGKLQRGDIVTELDGTEISSVNDAKKIFDKFKAGDTIDVEFYRNGNASRVAMTLKTKGEMLEADRNG